MNYSDLKNKILENKETKFEYENLEPEYQIAAEIIKARLSNSMTQKDIADLTGIDRSDISKIENATCNPSLKTLKRIANSLNKKIIIKFV